MGSIYFWVGNAAPVTQVDRRVPATVAANNDFSISRNGKTLTYRTAAGTVADVTAGLAAMVNNSIIPEFRNDILAVDNTTSIDFVSRNPGVPFSATYAAAVGGGGGAPTFAAAGSGNVVNTGPYNWDEAQNWRTAAGATGIPGAVAADSAIFENSSVPCLFGLDRSGGNTLSLLEVRPTYRGLIGLPRYNPAGYFEDRPDYLKIGATIVNVDAPSQRIKFDGLAIQTAVNMRNTGSPIEEGVPAFLFKGTNAANTFQGTKGYGGIAFFPGELATVADLNIAYQSNRDSDVNIWAGSGATLPNIDKSGGNLYLTASLTTFYQEAGLTYLKGDGLSITTATIDGGRFYCWTGSVPGGPASVITTLNVSENSEGVGEFNFDGDLRGLTVTNCNRYGRGRLIDNWTRVTFTNPIKLQHGSLNSPDLQLGEHISIQVAKLP